MSGYVLEGPTWGSSTITWSFADTTYAQDSADGFSAPIGDATDRAVIEAAVAKWQSISGVVLQQVVDSVDPSQPADIRIGFADLPTSASGEIGDTTYYASATGFEPDTIIQLEDPAAKPLVGSNAGPVYSGTVSSLYQIVLHELGHALGLGHNSDTASIMYPTATASNRDLDATDIAGIQALYGPPATPAVAPASSTADAATMTLHGTHAQYLIASTDDGRLYVADQIAGRDGTQLIGGVTGIRFADGTGLFDPTGDIADIARLYDAAFDRPADPGGLQYWAGQRASGMSADAIADAFLATPEFTGHQIRNNIGFVDLMYGQVLGHAPDAGGLQYWTGVLNAGADRGDVLLAFADSDEARAAAALTGASGDVDDAEAYRLYRAALDRAPDAGGLDYWSDALRAGGTPIAMAQAFLASPEYRDAFGKPDDAGFVGALYRAVLQRDADAGGTAYWQATLAGGASRAAVLTSSSDSTENRVATAAATHGNWVFVG